MIRRHAWDAMWAERPTIRVDDLLLTMEDPDHDDGRTASRWIGTRAIIVRYDEEDDRVTIRTVSATRRRPGW